MIYPTPVSIRNHWTRDGSTGWKGFQKHGAEEHLKQVVVFSLLGVLGEEERDQADSLLIIHKACKKSVHANACVLFRTTITKSYQTWSLILSLHIRGTLEGKPGSLCLSPGSKLRAK